jgi:hypothetical protein
MKFLEACHLLAQFLELASFAQFQQTLQPRSGPLAFVCLAGWDVFLVADSADSRRI